MKKRVSGEGLAANSASAFQEQLASIEAKAAAALAPPQSSVPAILPEPVFVKEAQPTDALATFKEFPWKTGEPLKRKGGEIQAAPQAKRQRTVLKGVKMLLESQKQHELLLAKSHHALQTEILAALSGNMKCITE